MKNLNRSKIVGVAAVSLAAVSLIGVGFASWIVGGITGTPTSGQVTVAVGTVKDNRINFSASGVETAINFDCNSNKANPIKASYEGSQAPEDLFFSLKYSLSSIDCIRISLAHKFRLVLFFTTPKVLFPCNLYLVKGIFKKYTFPKQAPKILIIQSCGIETGFLIFKKRSFIWLVQHIVHPGAILLHIMFFKSNEIKSFSLTLLSFIKQ